MGKKSESAKKAAPAAPATKSVSGKATKSAPAASVVAPTSPSMELKQPAAPEPAKKAAPAKKEPAKPAASTKASAVKAPPAKTLNARETSAAIESTPEPAIKRPSTDDIALRAYFIAEARQREGRPGDSTSDWVEAECQLLSELNDKSSRSGQKTAK